MYLEEYTNDLQVRARESAQIWQAVPIAQTPVENIQKQCRSLKINFIDPEFPPLETSLYPKELVEVGGPFDTAI